MKIIDHKIISNILLMIIMALLILMLSKLWIIINNSNLSLDTQKESNEKIKYIYDSLMDFDLDCVE